MKSTKGELIGQPVDILKSSVTPWLSDIIKNPTKKEYNILITSDTFANCNEIVEKIKTLISTECNYDVNKVDENSNPNSRADEVPTITIDCETDVDLEDMSTGCIYDKVLVYKCFADKKDNVLFVVTP